MGHMMAKQRQHKDSPMSARQTYLQIPVIDVLSHGCVEQLPLLEKILRHDTVFDPITCESTIRSIDGLKAQ